MAALTAALLAATTASTISKFAGDRRNARAAEQQGNYESAIYGQNATLADQQATDAIARGHEAELRSRGGTRQLVGSQRAALGAQGIALDSGSAQDVVQNDEALGELDALTIRNNARREAYGYSTQAAQYRQQGQMAQLAGQNTAKAYRQQGTSTLLAGAGDLFNVYQSYGLNRSPSTRLPSSPQGGYNLFRK